MSKLSIWEARALLTLCCAGASVGCASTGPSATDAAELPPRAAPSLPEKTTSNHVDDSHADASSPSVADRTTGVRDAAVQRGSGREPPSDHDAAWDAHGSLGDSGVAPERPSEAPGGYGAFPTSGDPGDGPWEFVHPDEVLTQCKLDPELLAQADRVLGVPYVIVRYGRVCHSFQTDETAAPAESLSLTKTFSALVAGRVAYETRELMRTGPRTGPFSERDRADHWLRSVPYNPEAHVAHVLGMVAQSEDLSLGKRTMEYDFFGDVQINTLSEMLNAAVAQRPTELGGDLEAFTQRHVFARLGMRSSSWTLGAKDKLFAFTWVSTPLDMARLGLVILHGGKYGGERLVDPAWIYGMTHPAFEDANTAWGNMTWLNASSNWHFGGLLVPEEWQGVQQQPRVPGPCAPVAVHRNHPHGHSDGPDCNYDAPYTCSQEYDVGVWQAIGINGKVIQGHPGLDLVLVVDNLAPLTMGGTAPALLWDAIRPAVIAADPRFAGDSEAFCQAYGSNRYAPDL